MDVRQEMGVREEHIFFERNWVGEEQRTKLEGFVKIIYPKQYRLYLFKRYRLRGISLVPLGPTFSPKGHYFSIPSNYIF